MALDQAILLVRVIFGLSYDPVATFLVIVASKKGWDREF
jgi:hypothetical protein